MPNPADYETLSEMTNYILRKLGYSSHGAASAAHKTVIQDYIKDSQEYLLFRFNDMLLQDVYLSDVTIAGESLYDLHSDCPPDQVREVVLREGDQGDWCKLKRGIPLHWRDDEGYSRQPYRYEIRHGTTGTAQIELFPTPDIAYRFGYEFTRKPNKLTDDDDRTSIDSFLVKTLALRDAAEFYSLPNAESLARKAEVMVGKLQARANQDLDIRIGGHNKPHIPKKNYRIV